jgi:hypothetical protein
VDLLDPRRRFPHWYMLEGFYGDLESRRGEYQGDPPPPPRVGRWMAAHAQRVADAADPRAHHPRMIHYHADVRQWVRDHGGTSGGRPSASAGTRGRCPPCGRGTAGPATGTWNG